MTPWIGTARMVRSPRHRMPQEHRRSDGRSGVSAQGREPVHCTSIGPVPMLTLGRRPPNGCRSQADRCATIRHRSPCSRHCRLRWLVRSAA